MAGVQAEESEVVGLMAVCLQTPAKNQPNRQTKSLRLKWDSGRNCFEIEFLFFIYFFFVRKTNHYICVDNGHW